MVRLIGPGIFKKISSEELPVLSEKLKNLVENENQEFEEELDNLVFIYQDEATGGYYDSNG